MQIRKISEDLVEDISSEKVEEIIKNLKNISEILDEKKKEIKKISTDLSVFSNKKKKKNDQIDDSILNFEKVDSNLLDALSLLDTVYKNLEDYRDNGRKYLY
jgi:ABC-type transporter Mla subunit MlaD